MKLPLIRVKMSPRQCFCPPVSIWAWLSQKQQKMSYWDIFGHAENLPRQFDYPVNLIFPS